MKYAFFSVLLFAICTSFSVPQNSLCLKPQEKELYDLLNQYRKQHKLPPIPLSYSLTKVSKLHVYDLVTNSPQDNNNCNLHSWSSKGKWTSCCYTGDTKSAECMWNKPKELTKYTGSGFEIAAYVTSITPKKAIDGWKGSKGHNAVMINKGTWKKLEWKAVGVGMAGPYAVIWFGMETDPDQTELLVCE